MFRKTVGRLAAAADLLRPRTLFRTLSRVDSLADRTRELTTAVEALRIQTDQLMTIQRVDWEKRLELARLDKWLDADRIAAHINAAFDATLLELDPYPHIVVQNWLPDDVYARVIDALPASVFFAHDRDEHWPVPFGVAPLYSRQTFMPTQDFVLGRGVGRESEASVARASGMRPAKPARQTGYARVVP